MIATIECLCQTCIDISDNCSCQYKYAEHFGDLQEICVETGIPFSIAGYDKGEVDHVEGLAKCSICSFFGMGGRVFYAMSCKDYLISKFGNKTTPAVLVKELKMEQLSDLHVEARLKNIQQLMDLIVFKSWFLSQIQEVLRLSLAYVFVTVALLSMDPALFSLNINSRPAHQTKFTFSMLL